MTPADTILAVRQFNRFYTSAIGSLEEKFPASNYSWTEARILYEIGERGQTLASALATDLRLDPGYLSRLLRRLEAERLLLRKSSSSDARQRPLALSAAGRKTLQSLNLASDAAVAKLIAGVPPLAQPDLIAAMQRIEKLLGPPQANEVTLRPHQPGDMGWILQRRALLYAREFGFDSSYEALVAQITGDFLAHFDPQRERCWIAQLNGQPVGSVFLMRNQQRPKTTAQLRLLFVEPEARGFGIGRMLIDECTRFARQAGYRRIVLLTHSIFAAAIHLYQQAGYRKQSEEAYHRFGQPLISQHWSLEL
jgi:DNA-binding MarR family transcriptional regulator/GNAT superfamily N-acetyltransferase